MYLTSSRLLLCLVTLCGALWGAPARADIALAAKRIDLPGASLQDVQAHISPGDVAGTLRLHLHASRADIPSMGWRRIGLTLDGNLQRDAQLRWVLDGKTQLNGAPGGALSNAQLNLVVDSLANTLEANFSQGAAHIETALPLDQPTHAQVSLKQLPAGWLQGVLSTVWSGRATGGRLDAELALDVRDDGVQTSGEFTFDDIGFDTPAGTLAGQTLGGGGQLGIDTTGGRARISFDGGLHGGELLLGPLYAKLPDRAVQLALAADMQHGAFALSQLRVNDADALQLEGALAFDAKGNLQKLKLDRFHANFPAAYQRYGRAWLNALGMQNMSIDGQLDGHLDLDTSGLRSFAFNTDGMNVTDGAGRLAVSGLRGGMDWSLKDERPATTLGWRSLMVYRIPNGAVESRWQSRDGNLTLQQPVAIPVMNGQLHVGVLNWRPAAAKGERLTTSLALTGVDMATFSRAMGWPAFQGTLGGAIPTLRWVNDRIELGGGLALNVFGGFIDITQMTLQQPFGTSPVLTGDITLNQIDLAVLTNVFDFGNINGRLDGRIDGLRLVSWTPVAFKASLLAAGGGRISQRAVNNLTTVGGGGMAGGLQGAVLKLFKNFGYKRIGLNCTLQADVCHMGGLDSDPDGYTIVEGSGLPHLQVIGHQAEVDWPTLVRRLKAATEGNGPEIR
ncbi:MAG: hypothetical protein WA777_10405 [Rhodanobacter sp.]